MAKFRAARRIWARVMAERFHAQNPRSLMLRFHNRFQTEADETRAIPIQRIDPDLERKQVERVRALRKRRDKAAWEASIKKVEDAARSGDNLMPHIIVGVESYATVGEISDALRKVLGEYQETVVV